MPRDFERAYGQFEQIVTRTHCRFLAILLLAAAIEPLRAQLHQWAPAKFGCAGVAFAQPFEDPGFGDPTTLGGSNSAAALPPVGSPGNPYGPNSYGPTSPMQPGAPVRPPSWPGGSPQPIVDPNAPSGPPGGFYRTATASPRVGAALKKSPADPPYDPAEILARIGSERIQACEVLPMINRAIHKAVGESEEFAKLSPEDRQHEIHKAQREYMKAALKELIGTKLLIAEVRGAADKKAIDENEKKIRDFFNTEYLKHLMEDYKASSIPDLENKLRSFGGSIESQRTLFAEQNLAAGWLRQQVKHEEKEPTHDEMLAYYRAHLTDWETPARVRWEQLTARFANFDSPQAARAALARWGNDVLVRRATFSEVAKAHSQDYAADDGGMHDWAGQGSLRSKILDDTLFAPALPPGAMSRILEDDEGCHIVRVLAREEAKRTPFVEAQPEIRKHLHAGGESELRAKYIETLRERTPVWTVFDDELSANGPPQVAPQVR